MGDYHHAPITCEFHFKCPRVWGLLSLTGQEKARYCGECQREVYLCESDENLAFHRNEGRCVAVPALGPKKSGEENDLYVVGMARNS